MLTTTILGGDGPFSVRRGASYEHLYEEMGDLPFVVNHAERSLAAASIKRNYSSGPGLMTPGGDRFTATNIPQRIFIRNAFRLQPAELIGGPDRLDDEHYGIRLAPMQDLYTRRCTSSLA